MKFMTAYTCRLTGQWLLFFLLMTTAAGTSAQLCQGSLGDPIVNITFGSGTNPGPQVLAAQGLQYQAADCPDDGFYAVRTSSVSCFNNSWHSFADHTNPGSGYCMIVNGSYQPSVFYLETVNNLCSGTTYEFAAWLMNIMQPRACNGNGILPRVTFSIEKTDGTVIQTYNTGSIPTTAFATWQQYGFFFTTPTGISTVVLRITNNAPGGCGNDIGLDDITFRPCGAQVVASMAGNSSGAASVCQGTAQSFQLSAQAMGTTATTAYQWQRCSNGAAWTDITGATSTSYTAAIAGTTAAGLYEYRLATADASNIGSPNCRIFSKVLTIEVAATPDVAITPGGLACTGKSFLLKATGGGTYSWTGPNGFTSRDSTLSFSSVQPAQDGVYTVTVTSGAGCTATKSFTLRAAPPVQLTTTFTDTTVCEKATVQLQLSGGQTYQWAPATGLSNATIAAPVTIATDSIRYRVVAANSEGCTDTAFVTINVVPLAIANAGPDKMVVRNTNDVLEGSIRNRYAQLYWQPAAGLSNAGSLQPQVTATGDAVYWLTAISPNGCGISTDSVQVKVYSDIYIPSAFTPNGDGKNEVWSIPSLQAFSQFELQVYNRFGQLVFKSRNRYQPWSGKAKGTPLPTGAYVYYLTVPELKKAWRGTVLIVR